jgi:hypothetical protein
MSCDVERAGKSRLVFEGAVEADEPAQDAEPRPAGEEATARA